MNIASVAEVKARLSAYLRASEEGPVVVTRNRKPVAVLLAVENDEELERLLLAHSKRFRAILNASWQEIEEGQGISHEAFWQEIEAGSEPRPAEVASPENTRI